MNEMIDLVLENADYFLLLLVRVGALVFSSPLFGRVNVPNMAKIGLMVSVTYLFLVAYPVQPDISYNSLVGYVGLIAMEMLIGVVLGWVSNLIFAMTLVAGQMIDMQIGFGMVNVYDVQNSSQVPMIGNLLNIILLVVFFTVDGHFRLFEILYRTLETMPVGNLTLSPGLGLVALEVFARAFTLGVMVAMPIVASGLVLEFCFGLMVRTVPQMNMFVVGIPLKLFVGLIILMFTIPIFVNFSSTLFDAMFEGIESMFSALAGDGV